MKIQLQSVFGSMVLLCLYLVFRESIQETVLICALLLYLCLYQRVYKKKLPAYRYKFLITVVTLIIVGVIVENTGISGSKEVLNAGFICLAAALAFQSCKVRGNEEFQLFKEKTDV